MFCIQQDDGLGNKERRKRRGKNGHEIIKISVMVATTRFKLLVLWLQQQDLSY